jgi:hypothetical protein
MKLNGGVRGADLGRSARRENYLESRLSMRVSGTSQIRATMM